jgi:hypothetical protein
MLIWINSVSKIINYHYQPLIITSKKGLQPLIIGNKYIKQVLCISNIYLLLLPITISMFCRSAFVHSKSALFSITRVNNGGTCV